MRRRRGGVYVPAVTSAPGTPRLFRTQPIRQAGLFRAQTPTRLSNLLTAVDLAPMRLGMPGTLSSLRKLFDLFDAGEYPHYASLFDDPVWQMRSTCGRRRDAAPRATTQVPPRGRRHPYRRSGACERMRRALAAPSTAATGSHSDA